ncbi:MAG: hypothetical protein DSZ27_07325 [Thiomicrospira sp.]|nr:MAG: hypothetical protein DSZ27_07325 [Thiomicrospira sp.]
MTQPSLQTLIARAKATLVNKFGVVNPAIDAIAAAIGGGNYGNYAYQDYLFKQLNPETCGEEWLYLWASRLNTERVSAVASSGTVNFSGFTGTVSVPSGTILKTQNNTQYRVTAETDASQPVPIESVITGAEYDLPAGVNLYLVTAVTGLDPSSITTNDISGGSDIEDLEHWRTRVIAAFNEQQAIGRPKDYVTWAISAHPDIDFAFERDNYPDTGKVTVYVGNKSASPLLSAAVKQTAQDYINSKRLAGCHAYVEDPVEKSIPITIADVADANTRTSIENAIESYFESRYGDKLEITPGQIIIVISNITTTFSLISPVASVTPAPGEILTNGGITWQ